MELALSIFTNMDFGNSDICLCLYNDKIYEKVGTK